MNVLLILISMSANAADLETLKSSYYEQRAICRVGDTATAEQSKAACDTLETIGKQLTDAGLCWDKSELVWGECPLTN